MKMKKVCGTCNNEFETDEWHNYQRWCSKECYQQSEHRKKQNRERMKELRKIPEIREYYIKKRKEWGKENPEKVKEIIKRYDSKHPEKNLEMKYHKWARKVMSLHLGRKLTSEEIVHHLDGNVINNEVDNLHLFPNHSEHIKYHFILRRFVIEEVEELKCQM